MADPSKIAILLKQVAMGVNAHDRENPDHHTWGIGMAHFDIERLGLDEGEELIPGIVLQADGGQTGQFRVLCDGQHDQGEVEEEEVLVDAVAEQELAEPLQAPGPVVTTATPRRPVARAYPSAAYTAVCSCRTPTRRMSESDSAFQIGRLCTPGRPNTCSTPSCSSDSSSRTAPVVVALDAVPVTPAAPRTAA